MNKRGNDKAGTRADPASLEGFADRLMVLMPSLMRGMMTQERNWIARGLLTLPQLWMLQTLETGGGSSMRDIVRAMRLKASTATGIADRLVGLGLLRRCEDAQDRRRVHLSVTRKGSRILRAIREEKRRMTIRLFRSVPVADRAAYLRAMERAVDELRRADAGDAG